MNSILIILGTDVQICLQIVPTFKPQVAVLSVIFYLYICTLLYQIA